MCIGNDSFNGIVCYVSFWRIYRAQMHSLILCRFVSACFSSLKFVTISHCLPLLCLSLFPCLLYVSFFLSPSCASSHLLKALLGCHSTASLSPRWFKQHVEDVTGRISPSEPHRDRNLAMSHHRGQMTYGLYATSARSDKYQDESP